MPTNYIQKRTLRYTNEHITGDKTLPFVLKNLPIFRTVYTEKIQNECVEESEIMLVI